LSNILKKQSVTLIYEFINLRTIVKLLPNSSPGAAFAAGAEAVGAGVLGATGAVADAPINNTYLVERSGL
jgi:hypothetical protein